jgi:hypothetical protein
MRKKKLRLFNIFFHFLYESLVAHKFKKKKACHSLKIFSKEIFKTSDCDKNPSLVNKAKKMDFEDEIKSSVFEKLEIGKDFFLMATPCQFQLNIQNFAIGQKQTNASDSAATAAASLYHICVVPLEGKQKGVEHILATFDASYVQSNRTINVDLTLSVYKRSKPNVDDGQSFALKLKKATKDASDNVCVVVSGLQITQLTSAQKAALKAQK